MNKRYHQTLLELHKQIKTSSELGKDMGFEDIEMIIFAGVGGSSLPGRIMSDYVDLKIPILNIYDYKIPQSANSKTLVICISYSGNTEETIDSYKHAFRRGCKILTISSGGKLEKLSKENNTPNIKVQHGIQPRAAIASMFFPILNVFEASGLIKNVAYEVETVIDAVTSDTFDDYAKDLSQKLLGKVPIIYSGPDMKSVAYKWKINFNENCKIHAFTNFFPELNHNEMTGFENPNANYYAIMIRDESDHRRIKDRINITKNLIAKKKINTTEISITGKTKLSRMWSSIHLSDLTSYHLAVALKTDPEPVHMIETLKKDLAKKKY